MHALFNAHARKFRFLFLHCFQAVLLVFCLNASAEEVSQEIKWIPEYFNHLDENTSLEEIADHVVQIKLQAMSYGYEVPTWDDFILSFKEALGDDSYLLSDQEASRIKGILAQKELEHTINGNSITIPEGATIPINQFMLGRIFRSLIKPIFHKHHHKHKSDGKSVARQPEMSDKVATAVMLSAGGALCFLLPIPGSNWLGALMIGTAVKYIVDDSLDKSAENRRNPPSAIARDWEDRFYRKYAKN